MVAVALVAASDMVEEDEEEEVVTIIIQIAIITITITITDEKAQARQHIILALRAHPPRHHLPWQFKAVVTENWILYTTHLRHTVYKNSIIHHHHRLLLPIKLLMSSYAVEMYKHYAIQMTSIH